MTKPPPELAYLLTWYLDLRRRAQRGYHFEPIQFTEMEAYARLHELDMDGFDVDMLCTLDDLWMASQPKGDSTPSPRRPEQTAARRRPALR